MKVLGILLLMGAAAAAPAFADTIDYAVGNAGPATLFVAGDGTVFVNYLDLPAGSTQTFTLYLWVEPGNPSLSFPSGAVPIVFKRQSDVDATGWFSATAPEVVFTGNGTNPVPSSPGPGYTGVPGGSYQAVQISFTVPSSGIGDDHVQVKIKADPAFPHLGQGHGIIVRLFQSATPPPPFTLGSWLSDSSWVPLSAPQYQDQFEVVTQSDGDIVATNPGSFYYNVLVNVNTDIDLLSITIDPIPADFVLWGANAVHAYVGDVDVTDPDHEAAIALGHSLTYEVANVTAGTEVFMTIHVQYDLDVLPSLDYLPRLYTFSCHASGEGVTQDSSASATGVLKDHGQGGATFVNTDEWVGTQGEVGGGTNGNGGGSPHGVGLANIEVSWGNCGLLGIEAPLLLGLLLLVRKLRAA